MSKGLKSEDLVTILEKQNIPERIMSCVAGSNLRPQPCQMESVMMQVVSDSLLTDYRHTYKYRLLSRDETNLPRKGEVVRLVKWQYDPALCEFRVEDYQNLSGGGNIANYSAKPLWELNQEEVNRRDCSFRILIAPKRPFCNLNKRPVTAQALEEMLVCEEERAREKIVDLTLECD